MGGGREPPSSSSQSLVFTNSHHHRPPQQQPQQPPSRNATGSTSYAHAALVKQFEECMFLFQSHPFICHMGRLMVTFSFPVVSSWCWFRGPGPGQTDSTQCWSSDTGTTKGPWFGPAAFISGCPSCQHSRSQHFHWQTARTGSTCTSALLVELGHKGVRIKHQLVVLTVQP